MHIILIFLQNDLNRYISICKITQNFKSKFQIKIIKTFTMQQHMFMVEA